MTNIYLKVFINRIKILMAAKYDFILGLSSSLIKALLSIIFLRFILLKFNSIEGLEDNVLMYIYFSIELVKSFINLFLMGIITFSSSYIQKGDLDMLLIKPVNKVAYIIADNINIKEFPNVIVNLIFFLITLKKLSFSIGTKLILFVQPLVIVVIIFSLLLIMNSFSFKYKDTLMANKFVIELLDFSKYPLTIYGLLIRKIFTFIIPLAIYNYLPIINLQSIYIYFLLGIFVAGVFLFISQRVFNRAFINYESSGS